VLIRLSRFFAGELSAREAFATCRDGGREAASRRGCQLRLGLAQCRQKGARMHVGMATVFQNPGLQRSDREELRLADLAEPLGFQSIWGVEHHFTD
jgi:hypothetical protein